MEIPKWEDKTPKSNKVEDGRLVRPFEQTVRKHPAVGALWDAFDKIRKKAAAKGRRPMDTMLDTRHQPEEDKDAGQE